MAFETSIIKFQIQFAWENNLLQFNRQKSTHLKKHWRSSETKKIQVIFIFCLISSSNARDALVT